MGKFTKKLVVYLDQNFISEMAKADSRETVNPQFKNIYELLHLGFLDEKIVVPSSFIHDIETSLIPEFEKRIGQFQGYLGQCQLQAPELVKLHQIWRSADEFLGQPPKQVDYHAVFVDDPDKILSHLSVRVKGAHKLFDWKKERKESTERLNLLAKKLRSEGMNYKDHLEEEFSAQGKYMLKNYYINIKDLFKNDFNKIKEFSQSKIFRGLPSVSIYAQMWSKLLLHYPKRPIGNGDSTDIDIISTYLPYVDVLATDTFMANLTRNMKLDSKYKTEVYGASKKELSNFESLIKEHLKKNEPVNKPTVSVFIKCDDKIKEYAWEYFRRLCHLRHERGTWVEFFAFNDGNMPTYNVTKKRLGPLPFYGLQEVTEIPLQSDMTNEDIVDTCTKRCRSSHFILIDKFRKLPDNFLQTLIMYCKEGRNTIMSYTIYEVKKML